MIKKAKEFAREKHKNQVRKFGGGPYHHHVEKVAKIIKENKKSHKLNELLAAALLHDTLEDTNTTEEELKENFGDLITSLVKELTTDKKESKIMGKKEYLANKLSDPEKISSWGLVIKLADRLNNVFDLQNGSKEFREKYIDETEHILKNLEEKRKLTNPKKELIKKIKGEIEWTKTF